MLTSSKTTLKREKEHEGSIWTHPYMVYIILTVILFLILVGLAYLAWVNGWIPNSGVSTGGGIDR